MKIYWDVEQRSEEWDRLRLGIPTASEFKKIVTPAGKLSAQAEGYMDQLLAEWMFGGPLEDPETQFQSQWMERGTFLENQAAQSYEFETDRETKKVGFVTTDDGMIGASPDRFVEDNGVLELKVPSPKVHSRYMRTGSIEQEYAPQLQGLLYVTERDFVDVQSFCPPFPTVIIPCGRNEKYIATLKDALSAFVETLAKAREAMQAKYGPFGKISEVPKTPGQKAAEKFWAGQQAG